MLKLRETRAFKKDTIQIFTRHTKELKDNKKCTEHFELNGAHLRQYLTRTENIHKVFVIESEDSTKIASLVDVLEERTFDGSDIDIEEFIGKILS